jgi:DoxX
MPDFAALRPAWEPRILSILRIVVGVLYMEHGLAKILDFPHQPTHAPYAVFTLNPGLQGLLELVGGLLLAVGLFTRPVALSSRGTWQSRISWCMRQEISFRYSTVGSWQSSTASSSSISGSPGVANGASIDCVRPHPQHRRAGPERQLRF